ncbi:Uncharacterised protein [BD1-7 clade bacterium]|uniref:Uncharacterized protein n=1 Tax=BD1-7 clade bacterium TaxID=2029982 RepID=A0A5S9NL10_9GAMM|nr:Uncharacterised protein [BD1-7 clade bacterium]CAA0093748.1 Uncharacterised protein [BD1-7 clade bacterium]
MDITLYTRMKQIHYFHTCNYQMEYIGNRQHTEQGV